jgi:hypothetical protein
MLGFPRPLARRLPLRVRFTTLERKGNENENQQEQLTAEFVQKIIDLSYILINIAKAYIEAAGYGLGCP